jgi:tetratricopeptide (TPR) repeat protein
MKTIKLTRMLACALLFILSGIAGNPAVAENRDFLLDNPPPVQAPGHEKPGENLPVLEPGVCQSRAIGAFAQLGASMERRGEFDQAIRKYDDVIEGCQDEISPLANQLVIWALSRKASALAQQGRYNEAIAACNKVFQYEYKTPKNSPVTRRILAWNLINKGILLRQQGEAAAANTVFGEVVRSYGTDFSRDVNRLALLTFHSSKFQAWSDALTGNTGGPQHSASSTYGWKSGVVGTLIALLALYAAFRSLKARANARDAAAQASRPSETPQARLAGKLPAFPSAAEFLQEHPSPDAETRRLQESAITASRAGQLETVRRDLEQALARGQERIKENANPYRLFEPIRPQDSTQTSDERGAICQQDIIHTEMLLAESVLEETKSTTTDAARSAELQEESLRICKRIAEEFADDPRPEIRAQAVLARFGESVILGQQGKLEDAIAIHDEIDRRYAEDAAPSVREQLAKALIYKGKILTAQDKLDAALDLYDEIDRRFGQDVSLGVRLQVAQALLCKSEAPDEAMAIAVCDEIVRRYKTDPSPAMRLLVAGALAQKSKALYDKTAGIAICDEMIRCYGEDTSPATRLLVAKMFIWKSEALPEDSPECAIIYDEILRRYGADPLPETRGVVALAYTLKEELQL